MRNMKFIVNTVLAVSSIAALGAGIRAHGAVSLAGHRCDPRQGQIHNPDRTAHDRKDHGGRHGRQGFLDCRRGGQLLLRASGETRHRLEPESDYGQRKHLQLHAPGYFRLFRRARPEGDRRTRRPLCDCGGERPRAVRVRRAARTVETASHRPAIARRAGSGRVQEQLSDAAQVRLRLQGEPGALRHPVDLSRRQVHLHQDQCAGEVQRLRDEGRQAEPRHL